MEYRMGLGAGCVGTTSVATRFHFTSSVDGRVYSTLEVVLPGVKHNGL